MLKLIILLAISLLGVEVAQAHAFLDHAEPAVGSTIKVPPVEVRIWFTEKLEAAFSRMQVFDERGSQVTQVTATVDSSNPALLTLPIRRLSPGTYKVSWKVMSVDTHVTTGSFTFTLLPSG